MFNKTRYQARTTFNKGLGRWKKPLGSCCAKWNYCYHFSCDDGSVECLGSSRWFTMTAKYITARSHHDERLGHSASRLPIHWWSIRCIVSLPCPLTITWLCSATRVTISERSLNLPQPNIIQGRNTDLKDLHRKFRMYLCTYVSKCSIRSTVSILSNI